MQLVVLPVLGYDIIHCLVHLIIKPLVPFSEVLSNKPIEMSSYALRWTIPIKPSIEVLGAQRSIFSRTSKGFGSLAEGSHLDELDNLTEAFSFFAMRSFSSLGLTYWRWVAQCAKLVFEPVQMRHQSFPQPSRKFILETRSSRSYFFPIASNLSMCGRGSTNGFICFCGLLEALL